MQIKGYDVMTQSEVRGNRYLYITRTEEGDEYAEMVYASEIFRDEDMRDCYSYEARGIYLIKGIGEAPERCSIKGRWSHFDDPLRMEIVNSKGKVLDVGYGTDH